MNVMNPEIDPAHLLSEIPWLEISRDKRDHCGKRHPFGAQENKEEKIEDKKKNR